MPSSASYTESQTESQSSRGPHLTQWLPQLVLTALLALALASVIGLSLSAVTFSSTAELSKPGHGIAQSFVMFASIHTLFYLPLHLLAARTDPALLDLRLAPPLAVFRHRLYAWAVLALHATTALWAAACLPVAMGIYRGAARGAAGQQQHHTTACLKADMFACATGTVFAGLLCVVVGCAARPFTLPWVTPAPGAGGGGGFDGEGMGNGRGGDKGDGEGDGEGSSTDGTLRGTPSPSPVAQRAKGVSPSSASSSTLSRASSSRKERERMMTRTRRYVLEAPTPRGMMSPVRLRGGSLGSGSENGSASPPASGSSSSRGGGGSSDGGRSSGDSGSKLEDELVPSVEESKSYFAAGSPVMGPGKGGGKRPSTPEVVQCCSVSPVMWRVRRKMAVNPTQGVRGGGDSASGEKGKGSGGEEAGSPQTAPPPPPPPPPSPSYYVPGGWVNQGHCDAEEVGGV